MPSLPPAGPPEAATPQNLTRLAEAREKGADDNRRLRSFDTTVGDREACAWLVAQGVVWLQVRRPDLAAKLEARQDTKLVAYGVAGGYLRTFEVPKGLAWAEDWINRHAPEGGGKGLP